MWGLILILIILGVIAVVAYVPALKGFRTYIFGNAAYVIGAVIPLLSEITGYLKELDWREFVLSAGDRRNLLVLAIPAGLGILMIIMRWITKRSTEVK